MLLFFAWAAAAKIPIGFAFPALTFEAFSYEILYFYFWAVARRYSDLCVIEFGEEEEPEDDRVEKANELKQMEMA